jgi:hypothetical protein
MGFTCTKIKRASRLIRTDFFYKKNPNETLSKRASNLEKRPAAGKNGLIQAATSASTYAAVVSRQDGGGLEADRVLYLLLCIHWRPFDATLSAPRGKGGTVRSRGPPQSSVIVRPSLIKFQATGMLAYVVSQYACPLATF